MADRPRLLLAVDFSPASAVAWECTLDLARRLEAGVVLVHAYAPLPRAPSLEDALREGPRVPTISEPARMHLGEAQDLAERWARPMRESGIPVDVIAQPGIPSDVILDAARHARPEMIIMGRQGQGRLRRVIIGSQSRYVSEHSDRPVLLVPSD